MNPSKLYVTIHPVVAPELAANLYTAAHSSSATPVPSVAKEPVSSEDASQERRVGNSQAPRGRAGGAFVDCTSRKKSVLQGSLEERH